MPRRKIGHASNKSKDFWKGQFKTFLENKELIETLKGNTVIVDYYYGIGQFNLQHTAKQTAERFAVESDKVIRNIIKKTKRTYASIMRKIEAQKKLDELRNKYPVDSIGR